MKLLLVLLAAVVEHIATTARGFLSRSTVLSMRRFAEKKTGSLKLESDTVTLGRARMLPMTDRASQLRARSYVS